MRKIFALSFLLSLTLGAFAETQPTNTDDGVATGSHHMNMGWVGLVGLIGRLGLRYQKSVAPRRSEAAGAKVTTVPVQLPRHSYAIRPKSYQLLDRVQNDDSLDAASCGPWDRQQHERPGFGPYRIKR
jgi:hypothetical protein